MSATCLPKPSQVTLSTRMRHVVAASLHLLNAMCKTGGSSGADFVYGIGGAAARHPCVPFLFRISQTSGERANCRLLPREAHASGWRR
jgi:hypothetical protein